MACFVVCQLIACFVVCRERHAAFEMYLEDRTTRATQDYQALLREVKCITHKSAAEVCVLAICGGCRQLPYGQRFHG
jgi:hypothetical protein